MAGPKSVSNNGRNQSHRKFYSAIGFTKSYNFVLWLIFSTALLGFLLARAPYMNFNGIFCGKHPINQLSAAPGECYSYFSRPVYKIGIIMHLCTIIPAGFLVLFQFVPIVRHKFTLFHRINGYAVIVLILLSNSGALMIARIAFGGTLSTQVGVGVLVVATTLSIFLAWINIKRLQIDQHRKWMLRAWFYFGSIITERLILGISMPILSSANGYYFAMPCSKIVGIVNWAGKATDVIQTKYPSCQAYLNGTSPNQYVVVQATANNGIENSAALLDIIFGMSIWLAIFIHALGIEVYLHLTPRESQRLKQVSYEKQVEAGMARPGDAGLTAQRLGDAGPFLPLDRGSQRE